ncbi:UNVERIFIED_CONTAM: hypothetical protein PYX00_009549 [Menopon gallinae]|uniref:C2H2-type domain-containing protein n=1 Tax=Menopon gallinae TaxID=328185 RepID=A0AAW2HBW0_9NEOP
MVNSNCRRVTDCSTSLECETPYIDMKEDVSNIKSQVDVRHCKDSIDIQESTMYEILPSKFFKNQDIPPPLVNKKWLSSVCEDCTSEDETSVENREDTVPLSYLKLTLSKIGGGDSTKKTKQLEQTGTITVIQRKRGRPRKQTENADQSSSRCYEDADSGNDSPDGSADWWSKSTDYKNDTDVDMRSDICSDAQKLEIINCEISDYLEMDEENSKSKTTKRVNKKDKSKENLGVKMENSKTVYPCLECGKTFSALSTLKYHLRIHNGTLIKCKECDRGFTTNYLLKCHMRIHNGDLFMCHKCGKGFITAELLKVHSRSHTGVRPYRCDTCGKTFPSASNLSQHKETHEAEKKYLCFQCGSSFSQKRCLDCHMLSHGEKNHICPVCGKLWARKSDLTEHMRVHTGSKPYSCRNCSQKFTQASSLRRHQVVHMEGNPIQCLTCGKMLKCDEYYRRHLKKHMKEKDVPDTSADKSSVINQP